MDFEGSRRIRQLTTGIFSEVASRKQAVKASGRTVIDLSVGSPDLPPSQRVQDALAKGVRDGTAYGYTLFGLPEFHSAVTDFYRRRYQVDLDPQTEVLQLMGSQDGLAHLALALLDEEDAVLVPNPGYPIYEASVTIAGAQIIPYPLLESNGFLPDLDSLEQQDMSRVRLMIVNYPGNPVAALANASFFERLVAFAKAHDIMIAHDFAYSELVFDGIRAPSLLATPGAKEVAIEFNSLSKTFNMAGCRIAYAVGNPQMLNLLGRLKSHIDYGVFEPVQRAAITALQGPDEHFTNLVAIYEKRRNALVDGLHRAGWPIQSPQATMFAWARIPGGWTSREFAFRLLDETGVAVVPGIAFGSMGEGFVRMALVQSESLLSEAAQRMGDFLSHRP